MSRSHRKTPICGITTARSEKFDKKMWHKRLRTKEKIRLEHEDTEDFIPIHKHKVGNVWSMQKDGKQRFDKDSPYYEKLMRK